MPISVDTSKPGVMQARVSAGATMINDVYALREGGALEAVAELGTPVCLMHMQGEPRTMQAQPSYDDVVAEVLEFPAGPCRRGRGSRGVPRRGDPGSGFRLR